MSSSFWSTIFLSENSSKSVPRYFYFSRCFSCLVNSLRKASGETTGSAGFAATLALGEIHLTFTLPTLHGSAGLNMDSIWFDSTDPSWLPSLAQAAESEEHYTDPGNPPLDPGLKLLRKWLRRFCFSTIGTYRAASSCFSAALAARYFSGPPGYLSPSRSLVVYLYARFGASASPASSPGFTFAGGGSLYEMATSFSFIGFGSGGKSSRRFNRMSAFEIFGTYFNFENFKPLIVY